MIPSIYLDTLFICLYIAGFVWVVVIVTIMLERKRRHTLEYFYSPIIGSKNSNHNVASNTSQPRIASYMTSFSPQAIQETVVAIAEMEDLITPELEKELQLPPKAANDEPLTIHIVPDGTKSQKERNIQRLIDHLKSTSATPVV